MAIVQISRITARKGLQEDLPQPLAGAELGWSVDTRQLWIGNGTTEEGAPALGNTEILTEYSDILSYANQYVYKGTAAGYTAQTGPSLNSPSAQSLQSRLDSYCVITDFGAVGDGVQDCTNAINRALYQIYCREVNPQIRRSIFFPAGVYKVSGTLLIPPYASLYGEGRDSSVIAFDVQTWSSAVAWSYGVLVINSGNYFRCINLNGAPIGAALPAATTGPTGTNAYWQYEAALPSYIARTANNFQQIDTEIPNGIAPTEIEIDSMSFTTTQLHSGVLLQDTSCATFRNVAVAGPLLQADLTDASDNIKAVDFASTASLITQQIVFDACAFEGFTWAANTQQQVKSIAFNECQFNTLYQGVYLGGATPVLGGPVGVTVSQSQFDKVYAEGVVINGVSLNSTQDNIFFDVGNHFNGVTSPATSIISINAANNICIGDKFQRTAAYSTVYPRINLQLSASYAMTNAEKIEFGTYTREVGQSATLVNNSANQAVTTVNSTLVRAFQINYTIVRSTTTRTGTLTVVPSTDGTGVDLAVNDAGIQNASTGVTFNISETGSVVSIKASTTNTGVAATLNYSITHLA